jgi:16S rRNA (adenine1518-N6/adenine1519-N6)-dimethyltransferase
MKLLAKKSLGQNFLHAPHVVSAMVNSAEVNSGSLVLEIGPGTGALTKSLLLKGARVVAIEKDDRAIPILKEMFAKEIGDSQLNLVHGDALDILRDPQKMSEHGLEDKKYILVANIPYYITGELMRLALESETEPSRMVIMVEKSVADRIMSRDGKESILSISVKAYGVPSIVCKVSRKLFRPIPGVDSAVIMLNGISKDFFTTKNITESEFFSVVRLGFAHKRKILLGNLKKDEENDVKPLLELWEKEDWSPKIRAEELSVDGWAKIAYVFHKKTQ